MGQVRNSITALLAAALLLQSSIAAAVVGEHTALELAQAAGRWLLSVGQTSEDGTAWPGNALGDDTPAYDLAGGTAGTVVFLAALAEATGDETFRAGALRGADALAALVEDAGAFEMSSRGTSLYAGIAGVGVALMAADELEAGRYRQAVERVIDHLSTWAVREESSVRWSETFNDLLYGDAGTVLFLAFVADRYDDDRAFELAVAGGHGLIEQAERRGNGLWWQFRRDRPFNLPNFSHGTAGIVYVLATLSSMTGDAAFTETAAGGFRYLRSIATQPGGRLVVPYGWPEPSWEGVNAYGWGHGIAGTSLAFRRLEQAAIDATMARELHRDATESLLASGLPGDPLPPYSEASTPIDFRFGRAGVLSVLARFAVSDVRSTAVMDEFVDHLLNAATVQDDRAHWVVDVPPFMGEGQAAFTGLFHGAAGIGLALLERHAQRAGDDAYVLLPDDPRWQPRAR